MKRSTFIQLLKVLVVTAALVCASEANAQPLFSKSFSPSTIGQGGSSRLTFTIVENSGRPTTSLAFVDNLPPGVNIATPANVLIDGGCRDVVLLAPDGGTTVTLSDGGVGGGSTCTLAVDVTSSTVATHVNVTGDLTSSSGNSGTATANLTVSASTPGFSKSFSPSTIGLGGRSTLTFTIDNTANTNTASSLRFTDNLPAGIVVASPANASTDCVTAPFVGGALTAVPGSSMIQMSALGGVSAYAVAASATCTVSVDVIGESIGSLVNVSGALEGQSLFTFFSTGPATATLDVAASTELILSKAFSDDPVPPGGTATIEFTIRNRSRSDTATSIAFTDDLGATLSGLAATGLPLTDVCGAGSTLSGTSLVSLTGGTLTAGADCTFSVSVAVPAGAAPGAYPNTTSSITATFGGSGVTGDPATETLFVAAAPVLTKTFTNDPLSPGDTAMLEFTVTNTSATSAATDITFTDRLTNFLPFPVSATLPSTPCGAGSILLLTTPNIDTHELLLQAGTLAAGASCTFTVGLDIPLDVATNSYVNATDAITATVDGAMVTGVAASDTLVVVAAPNLSTSFTDDPVVPGGTVTLEFRLTNSANAPTPATGITFTNDLAAMLTGVTANLPSSPDPPCGPGSSLVGSAGDTLLTLMGGSLDAGEACTFTVSLDVPVGATPGSYANATSAVSATVGGLSVMSRPATGSLSVSGLVSSKEFIDDPALPGETVTLRFTLENTHPTDEVTAISFTDSLSATLSGLAAVAPLPTNPCGSGSVVTGTFFLNFAGGNLAAGDPPCSFDIQVLVPPGAADGTYSNTTGAITGVQGGTLALFGTMADTLVVDSNRLLLTKQFTDDPVAPGSNVALEFTLTNSDAAQAAANIAFTDDLDASLPGLTATSVESDTCGAMAGGTGTGVVSFSGISLAASASCTIRLVLAVPVSAVIGQYTNTTSAVSGDIGGLGVNGIAASDTLVVDQVRFTMSFLSSVIAGQTVTLRYVIENLGANARSGLQFFNDLGAAIPGMTATSTPQTDACGLGSSLTGTSALTLAGGNVAPMGSCTIDVTILVPAATPVSVVTNTTTGLREGGNTVADAATAELTVLGEITNGVMVTADGAVPANGSTTDTVSP